MLQACLYAERPQVAITAATAHEPWPGLRASVATLLGRGRSFLQGAPEERLNDHLLHDIGISHADLAALKL